MKKCTSCGNELSDNARFCTKCGAKCTMDDQERIPGANMENTPPAAKPVPPEETSPSKTQEECPASTSHPTKKPISKGKIILIVILIAVLALTIVAAILLIRWYTSTAQQLLRALDAGDYDTAVSIMEENPSDGESSALAEQLKERIASIKDQFTEGAVEYSAAKTELSAIGKLHVDGISAELAAVQNYVDSLNASRTSFSTAESFYATGDYAEAIENYRLVIEDDANYAAAVENLANAVNAYRSEALAKAAEYADAKLYSDAIALLNEALVIVPNDASITEQIRIYEKDHAQTLKADALEAASDYARNADYLNAFKTLANVMNTQTNDAELVSAYNRYCEQYVSQIVDRTVEMAGEKDFDGAIFSLNEALKQLPGNETLLEKFEEIESMKPISITELVAVNENNWSDWNTGSPTDPFGTDYSTSCNYIIFGRSTSFCPDEDHYAEYRLYGNYTTLTGTIATHTNCPENRISRLQIYSDDVLVYTSSDMGRKTDAVDFSVDVRGAEYIKILVYTESNSHIILSNVQLWP